MKSQYDGIKTARELLTDVAVRGFSIREEDICRAQDIFGHSTIEELAELAHEHRDRFYFVAFKIWGWETATEFWNEHSNPDREKMNRLKVRNVELEAELKKAEVATEANEELKAELLQKVNEIVQLKAKLSCEHEALEEKDQEIIRLKAKLYDMMIDAA